MPSPLVFAQAAGQEASLAVPWGGTFPVFAWVFLYAIGLLVWAASSTACAADAKQTFGSSTIWKLVFTAVGLLVFVATPAIAPRLLWIVSTLLVLIPSVYWIARFYKLGGTGLLRAIRMTVVLAYRTVWRLITFLVEVAWSILQALMRFDWEALKRLPAMGWRTGQRVRQIVAPGTSRLVTVLQASGLPLDADADPRFKSFPKTIVPRTVSLVQEALRLRATEIYLLSQGAGGTEVRFKSDGTLLRGPVLSREEGALCGRAIKTIAGMSTSANTAGVEGAFAIMCGGRRSDVFVETAAGDGGETIVLRITADEKKMLADGLGGLGMDDSTLAAVRNVLGQNDGLVVVAGRPDSGKSSTIYGAIHEINGLGRTIATVEKSVRHRLEKIPQIRAGGSGAAGLTAAIGAALQQDPDVLVVRDIMDRESAEMCLKAAAAGRLVVAGFSADDAVDALQRLLLLGIDPGLLRLGLKGIVCQRLVRVLCASCKTAYQPPADLVAKLGIRMTDDLRFQRETGCGKCHGTGYLGRTGIFELLLNNETVGAVLASENPTHGMRQSLRSAFLRTLRQSAAAKVYHGVTSINEIARALK